MVRQAVQHTADVGGARVRRGGNTAALHQRVDHRHVHVQIVRLLEALAADHAGELQVSLGLVLGHVVLEGRPLPALEAAHLTPETDRRTEAVNGVTKGRNVSTGT